LRIGAEPVPEAQGGVAGHGALTRDNLADPVKGYAGRHGPLPLANFGDPVFRPLMKQRLVAGFEGMLSAKAGQNAKSETCCPKCCPRRKLTLANLSNFV
jgi:hypothetical protein